MKTFNTNGTGNQQTLSEIESDKMPIYKTKQDAETNLTNLSEGQLVGIEDTGDELSQPVDVVEEDNLHAVTSNAVAQAISNHIKSVSVSASTDSSGNAYLGYDFVHMIPIAFVPINYGAELVYWQFAIYGNNVYIRCNRASLTIEGTLYYLER